MSILADTIIKSVGPAAENTAESLTRQLHAFARAYSWPINVVLKLRVVMDHGKYTVSYPKSIENEVLTLEYGSESTPGTHMLHAFLESLHDTKMDEEIYSKFVEVGLA